MAHGCLYHAFVHATESKAKKKPLRIKGFFVLAGRLGFERSLQLSVLDMVSYLDIHEYPTFYPSDCNQGCAESAMRSKSR